MKENDSLKKELKDNNRINKKVNKTAIQMALLMEDTSKMLSKEKKVSREKENNYQDLAYINRCNIDTLEATKKELREKEEEIQTFKRDQLLLNRLLKVKKRKMKNAESMINKKTLDLQKEKNEFFNFKSAVISINYDQTQMIKKLKKEFKANCITGYDTEEDEEENDEQKEKENLQDEKDGEEMDFGLTEREQEDLAEQMQIKEKFIEASKEFYRKLKYNQTNNLNLQTRGSSSCSTDDTISKDVDSEKKESMNWFKNLDQGDKDKNVQLFSQMIQHYGSINVLNKWEDIKKDMEQKFEINPSQTKQLFEFWYSVENTKQRNEDAFLK